MFGEVANQDIWENRQMQIFEDKQFTYCTVRLDEGNLQAEGCNCEHMWIIPELKALSPGGFKACGGAVS